MRHVNIPIFIPHLGCPNDCIFCNQHTISGCKDFDAGLVECEIAASLETIGESAEVQIAFFGGSFTGIGEERMTELLESAQKYVRLGRVGSIRLSTRPDYINEDIIKFLERYPVKTVELGIQSMNDRVLALSRRGHNSEASRTAMKLVVDAGFELVGQMMVGLPGSSLEDELETARIICDYGAAAARIYPTVVLSGTGLEALTVRGEYTPLSTEEAVYRCKEIKKHFILRGVECIRLGLQSGVDLAESQAFEGYHSALGELVETEIYYDIIKAAIEEKRIADKLRDNELEIYAACGETSKVLGHRGRNRERLQNEYCVKKIKVIENDSFIRYNILLSVNVRREVQP